MGLAMEHAITVTMGHLTTSPTLPWPTRHHGTTRFLFRWTDIISRCERTMLAGNSRPSSPSPVCSPVLTCHNHSEKGRVIASFFLWLGCGDHKIFPKSPVWEGLAELIIILSWWSSYHFNITFCFTISKLVTLATFPHVWLLLNKEIFKRQISIKYEKFWPKGPTFCPFSSFFCTLTLFSFNIQQGRSTSRCIYVFFLDKLD